MGLDFEAVLRRLPTVMPIFGYLGNTLLMHMSYFFQHDMKIATAQNLHIFPQNCLYLKNVR